MKLLIPVVEIIQKLKKIFMKGCIAIQRKTNSVHGKILWNICIRS